VSAVFSRRHSYHSQADSAGSIPVTRSTRQNRCQSWDGLQSHADSAGASNTPEGKHRKAPASLQARLTRGRESAAAPSIRLPDLQFSEAAGLEPARCHYGTKMWNATAHLQGGRATTSPETPTFTVRRTPWAADETPRESPQAQRAGSPPGLPWWACVRAPQQHSGHRRAGKAVACCRRANGIHGYYNADARNCDLKRAHDYRVSEHPDSRSMRRSGCG
jgi:hypothetical protein